MAFSEPTEDVELMRPPEGAALSFDVGEDVTRGQVVKLGSDYDVQPSDTDGEVAFGVATQTVASGGTATVISNGARVLFTAGSGTVGAGQKLRGFGGTGDEGTVEVASTTGDFIVGYALESASSVGDTFVGLVDLGGEVN